MPQTKSVDENSGLAVTLHFIVVETYLPLSHACQAKVSRSYVNETELTRATAGLMAFVEVDVICLGYQTHQRGNCLSLQIVGTFDQAEFRTELGWPRTIACERLANHPKPPKLPRLLLTVQLSILRSRTESLRRVTCHSF